MTLLPVIERELRVTARQPLTYFSRVLAAAALLGMSLVWAGAGGWQSQAGPWLFARLHSLQFIAIWVLVPLLTADSISRERREGTLGILLMTPLRPWEIVLAKCSTGALRAVTWYLAALPVLTLPFLLGGVSWREAWLSVVVNFGALCGALAAGILASAWSRALPRALLTAFLMAAVLFVLLEGVAGGLFLHLIAPVRGAPWTAFLVYAYGLVANIPTELNFTVLWRFIGYRQIWWPSAAIVGLGLLCLAVAVLLGGHSTRQAGLPLPPSRRRLWLGRIFCSPFLGRSLLRSWMVRKLELNPIGWLEQRRWSGRLVMWSWMAAAGVLCVPMIQWGNFNGLFLGVLPRQIVAWLLAGSLALTAAASFRRERETGLLELLLVSPLGEGQIVWGRLRGLWGQFLPALSLLVVCWALLAALFRDSAGGETLLSCLFVFLFLPVIGLYCSLRFRSFLPSFMLTLAVGEALPQLVSGLVGGWAFDGDFTEVAERLRVVICAGFVQALMALAAALLLRERLRRRAFAVEQGAA